MLKADSILPENLEVVAGNMDEPVRKPVITALTESRLPSLFRFGTGSHPLPSVKTTSAGALEVADYRLREREYSIPSQIYPCTTENKC